MDFSSLAALSLDAAEGLVKIGVALLAVWLFCVGASVGSFLNVVVYRLPLGKSLIKPGSCCPVCGHEIRARHNIPILGWLSLGGKCFDCRTPISSRYPLVELLVGIAFFVLGVEFLLGGNNLGDFSQEAWGRMPWPALGRAYAMHAVLVTTLIGAALIVFDGRRIPISLYLPTLTLSLLLPLFHPDIRPLAPPFVAERGWRESLAEGALGVLAGVIVGLLLGAVWRIVTRFRDRARFRSAWSLASVGAALGWQAVVIASLYGTLVFALGVLLTQRRRGRHLPWPGCVALVLLVLIPTYYQGLLWNGPPRTTAALVYEIAIACNLLIIAMVAATTPARYWRRAPRSFPLQNVSATPAVEPVAELAAEPPLETSQSEPPHDS